MKYYLRKTYRILVYSIVLFLFTISLGLLMGSLVKGYLVIASAFVALKLMKYAQEEFQFLS